MEIRDNTEMTVNTNDIMPSVLKLMRAMRRRPMERGHGFPPSVERMLMVLNENDGASPALLCELMDVRPSSMSELLGRMEKHELVIRVENEEDKRATKVFLSEKGKASVAMIEEKVAADNAKLAECFTEEELVQFCALCDKLSDHLETMTPEGHCGPAGRPGHHGPHGHGGPGHHGPCGGPAHHCCPGHHGPRGPWGGPGHHGPCGFPGGPRHHKDCFRPERF